MVAEWGGGGRSKVEQIYLTQAQEHFPSQTRQILIINLSYIGHNVKKMNNFGYLGG